MLNSKVLFLMTGSISAYKACHVISRLVQDGHRVQVAASKAALEFVGTATLEGLTGLPVATDLWEKGRAMDHIHLVREADLVVVAPASANFLNRAAAGIADDLIGTLLLAHDFDKPFLIVPAMNASMYRHPATRASVSALRQMGLQVMAPAAGHMACGETGDGRLPEPEDILNEIRGFLKPARAEHILITAGGTEEPLDDVRFLTNNSSGRSGARLADHLNAEGFRVTLLKARRAAAANSPRVRLEEFRTYNDLRERLRGVLATGITHVIHMAAVADYVPAEVLLDGVPVHAAKIPSGGALQLNLKPTAKLIAQLKEFSPLGAGLKVAGFKLTGHLDDAGRRAAAARVLPFADLVVHNDLADIDDARGVHPYRVFDREGDTKLENFSSLASYFTDWAAGGTK